MGKGLGVKRVARDFRRLTGMRGNCRRQAWIVVAGLDIFFTFFLLRVFHSVWVVPWGVRGSCGVRRVDKFRYR